MNLTKEQRAELRIKFRGRCAYCGCDLPEKGWHADHVEPVDRVLKLAKDKRGYTVSVATGQVRNPSADKIENLFPACAPCNIDKQSLPLYLWRRRLEDLADNCRRNCSAFRRAERFRRVSVIPGPVVFWFETFQEKTAKVGGQTRQSLILD